MIVLDYSKKFHKEIIKTCAAALKAGKVVAYPTDTSYGLAADATNISAVKKLYRIKERGFSKPVHVVVPSKVWIETKLHTSKSARRLMRKFWPGPLTLVLPIVGNGRDPFLQILSANTKSLGIRMPKNKIALDLVKHLKKPITATSANPSLHLSGGYDSYSAEDIIKQFRRKRHKPDMIINAGRLPRRKPSTIVKIDDSGWQILRNGPISEKKIKNYVNVII